MRLFGRRKQTVGLDIGSGLVKAVVVDHGGPLPEVTRVAVTPLADEAIVEGEVMDPALVADAVRDTLAAAGAKGASVVVAIGGRDVIVKRIRTDRVKPAQAREFLRFEAQQHVPFDMDAVEFDFQLLDADAAGEQMSVLFVAAKRELVAAKLRLLEDAGTAASVVDVDAFALHNAFEASHPDQLAGVVGLASVGNEVTTLNVLDDGIPVLTRDLAIGTRRLREELRRELALVASDAEAVLRGERPNNALGPIVQRVAEDVATGIERATAVLDGAGRGARAMQALHLCGGGARIPGLAAALAARLRVQVTLANPLASVAVRDGAFDALDAEAVAPLLMLPLGLALRRAA
jgi:type IV pilus assembly protein PilM